MAGPQPTGEELDSVYAASLEFGSDWRRPVADLAAQRLPGRSAEHLAAAADAVGSCRSEIEQHIAVEHRRLAGAWTRADEADVDAWIASKFPWMSRANRRRALRQGQYYAHHDGW